MLSCKANEENRATHFWYSVMLGAAVLFMELSICLPLMWLNESARKGFKRIYIGGKYSGVYRDGCGVNTCCTN